MTSQIYRYKFTSEFTVILYEFSKIHQYDERKIFKESFDTWLEENKIAVEEEELRLQQSGYVGDVKQKIFKSARYYFRTKEGPPHVIDSTPTQPQQTCRKKYTSLSVELLEVMKKHIERTICLKPSVSYDLFYKNYEQQIAEEVKLIEEMGENATLKIKKSFKNQYFIVKSLSSEQIIS